MREIERRTYIGTILVIVIGVLEGWSLFLAYLGIIRFLDLGVAIAFDVVSVATVGLTLLGGAVIVVTWSEAARNRVSP